MKRSFFYALSLWCALTSAAFALDLDSAKAQGLVGERRDGYLGLRSGGAEVQALVDDVNAKRRAEYERIAQSNGQPIATVEKLAAAKAYSMTPKGQYVMDAGGAWVQR